MRIILASALLLTLSACAGGGASGGSGGSGGSGSALSDIGASFEGGGRRDTLGSMRRPDVYGGSTAPSLPTIGASGFGK